MSIWYITLNGKLTRLNNTATQIVKFRFLISHSTLSNTVSKMLFSQSLPLFLSLGAITSGSVIPRADVDSNNPEASDPKTPPKKLNRPPRPDNPFKGGFKTAPASCTDFMKPSKECITDLQAQPGGVNAFSGGELKWDGDNKCDDKQRGMFQTAAWDAHALATFSNQQPDPHNARDVALWKTWMGPDYSTQQQRIAGMF